MNNENNDKKINNNVVKNVESFEIISTSDESPCKELFIDYNDVVYIKDFTVKNPEFYGSVDPDLFEKDADYRNSLMFKFNPLVKIGKRKDIDMMVLKEENNMGIKEFAATLGLTHADDRQTDRHSYKTRQKRFSKTVSYQGFFPKRSDEKENRDFKLKRDLFNKMERKKYSRIRVVSETESSEANNFKYRTRRSEKSFTLNSSYSEKNVDKNSQISNNKKVPKVILERKRLPPPKPVKTKMWV